MTQQRSSNPRRIPQSGTRGAGSSLQAEALSRYKAAQQLGTSGIERLLLQYDDAIHACDERNSTALTQALGTLRQSLRTDADPQTAANLLHLYKECKTRARSGNFEAASHLLCELKSAWEEAARASTDKG